MSGTTLRGLIKLNDTLLLGPDPLGNFLSIAVKSIHRKRMPVKEVRGGQTASFALKKVSGCAQATCLPSREPLQTPLNFGVPPAGGDLSPSPMHCQAPQGSVTSCQPREWVQMAKLGVGGQGHFWKARLQTCSEGRDCGSLSQGSPFLQIKRSSIRKGMVMVSPRLNPQASWEFEAEILVLHHPTTISPRYQAMGRCAGGGVLRECSQGLPSGPRL